MTLLERELLEALLEVVNQSCQVGYDHEKKIAVVDPMGSATYEGAIELLERLGYATALGKCRWQLVWPREAGA